MSVTTLIADDHALFLAGLKSILAELRWIDVVGEAKSGTEAVALAHALRPDLVIMDIAMPGLNGIEATHRITEDLPECTVLALSMHADSRFVRRMLESGAEGYLLKDCAFEELELAIREALAGRTYLSNDVARSMGGTEAIGDESAIGRALTPREREVLRLLSEGRSTRRISQALGISVKTVESHRKHMMDKLELRSVAELTKYAIGEGITDLKIQPDRGASKP